MVQYLDDVYYDIINDILAEEGLGEYACNADEDCRQDIFEFYWVDRNRLHLADLSHAGDEKARVILVDQVHEHFNRAAHDAGFVADVI
jgi:hypothetical protein